MQDNVGSGPRPLGSNSILGFGSPIIREFYKRSRQLSFRVLLGKLISLGIILITKESRKVLL